MVKGLRGEAGVRAARWAAWAIIGLIPVAGSAGVAACGGAAGATAPAVAPTSTQADDEAAADVTEHHRHHHHGGIPMFIAMSLDTLGVSAEQRAAIDAIQADLYARMEPARAAEQAVLETLADGIAAGSIDAAKVSAELAQLAAAAAGLHDAEAEALNRLHAALTPDERAALADKVEAHWALWRRANGDEAQAAPGAPVAGHLQELAAALSLSSDQVEKAKANIVAAAQGSPVRPDPQAVDAYVQAFAGAFKADSFDAKSLAAAGPANAHIASWGASRIALLLESVAPVLTPDQRAKLAEKVREHADHRESPAG